MSDKLLIVRRYARALFEVAEKDGELSKILNALDSISELLSESEDLRLISEVANKSVSVVLAKIISEKLEVSGSLKRFLEVLAESGRISIIPDICSEYKKLVDKKSGKMNFRVVTSRKLLVKDKSKFKASLESCMGCQVGVLFDVDPELLSGFKIFSDTHVVDVSLMNKLDQLRLALSGENEYAASSI